MRALYTFAGEQNGDLPFSKGDIINLTKKSGQWWEGSVHGKTGVFPNNYVEEIPTSSAPSSAPVPPRPSPPKSTLSVPSSQPSPQSPSTLIPKKTSSIAPPIPSPSPMSTPGFKGTITKAPPPPPKANHNTYNPPEPAFDAPPVFIFHPFYLPLHINSLHHLLNLLFQNLRNLQVLLLFLKNPMRLQNPLLLLLMMMMKVVVIDLRFWLQFIKERNSKKLLQMTDLLPFWLLKVRVLSLLRRSPQ